MSSLNITVEIKAPRLRLIKTQGNQSPLLSGAPVGAAAGAIVGAPRGGICMRGARHRIASRRALICTSDNNYRGEYTQNDFLCDADAAPTPGRGDKGARRKGRVSEGSPRSCGFD